MAPTDSSPPLMNQTFVNRSLRASRFIGCDLTGVVVRGSELAGLDLDSPWLAEGDSLWVNCVDVVPLVDAELNRRFPGRELRHARDPQGLRAAWAALTSTWAATTERAQAMPKGTVDASVAGEWSFAQTLRHLVMATDTWLGLAVLRRDSPYHPLGLANDDGDSAYDDATFTDSAPSFEQVLEVRAERQAMVRDFLGEVTAELLAETRANPHGPQHAETVLSCIATIVEEEWEHHRYAVRDLDILAAESDAPTRDHPGTAPGQPMPA